MWDLFKLSGKTCARANQPVRDFLPRETNHYHQPLKFATECLVWGLLAVSLLLLSGCASSTTGMQTDSPSPELEGIRRMEIKVSGSDQMYVSQSVNRGGVAGWIALGIIGAAVESGIRTNIDQRTADSISPELGRVSVPQSLEQVLVKNLSRSKQFDLIIPSNNDQADLSSAQAQVLVDLIHWGLYPPVHNQRDIPEDYVQVGMEATVKIIDLDSGDTLWSSKEIYLHGKDHLISEYQASNGLLQKEVTQAIIAVSDRLSRAIRQACR
jgi:hypothetical protein